MKRFIAVLSGLLVLPAFAEVAPAYYYEEVMEYSDEYSAPAEEEQVAEEKTETKQAAPVVPVTTTSVSPRTATGRITASRAIPSTSTTSSRNTTTTRTVSPARTVTARTTATNTVNTATSTRTVSSGRPTTTGSTATTSARSIAPVQTVTTRQSSTNNNRAQNARASIVQTDTVATPLYVSSRVGTSTSAVRSRTPTIRAGTTTTTTTDTSSSMSLDELAQITDFCKAQYTSCMDNFCNVLDDNQGRCSCSANLKNYAETEAALKQATEELQDVAQKIQYIGLSSDEIETLFTQTEAELEMQTTTDNTQLKNDLDKIKKMIIDVETGKASSTTTSGLSLDLTGLLDFTIDSTGFDLGALLGTSSDTSSISNQRGEQLYKTAAARCKASVLNSCAAQGVDITVITNSYDLEIDKQCIIYERSLTDSNDQMSATVRNAKSVLQKARLLVAQQKNAYDLRGCVNALDSCMQDDFVCGSDYENCLDPTGKFIVNGEIVIGSKPGVPGDVDNGEIYQTWTYDNNKNAWGDSGLLSEYITNTVTANASQSPSTNMSAFLQNKIGYHDDKDGKNYGMCMSVLNKCQDITYTGTGQNLKYNPTNNVIKEFLNRTLIQIKSAQDSLLSEYAETCITDVSSCLAQNNYNTLNPTSINIAINACKANITTCMSATGATGTSVSDMANWVGQVLSNPTCPSNASGTYPDCVCTSSSATYIPTSNVCMSCPTANAQAGSKYPNCQCNAGYTYNQRTNTCDADAVTTTCPADSTGTYPSCVCNTGTYNSETNTCDPDEEP